MLYQARQVGGTSALDLNTRDNMLGPLPEATEQEAAAVSQAIGVPKNYRRYGGSLARVTSARSDSESGYDTPTEGFLPAGIFRSIVPDRADVALNTPQMQALASDVWDEDEDAYDEKSADNANKEGEPSPEQKSSRLGVAKTVEQRRPSVRESNPWLDQILRSSDKGRRLSPGPGHARSLSK